MRLWYIGTNFPVFPVLPAITSIYLIPRYFKLKVTRFEISRDYMEFSPNPK